jgi:polyhydroxyalkanoate synthesis regulator phasin
MSDEVKDFMLELLKKLNQRFDKLDYAISEVRNDNMALRNQVHTLQGDVNGLRGTVAHIENRLDRIENRLELREFQDAQARFEPQP